MDIRIRTLNEKAVEYKATKSYFFDFKNSDGKEIANVTWIVDVKEGKQLLTLDIIHGEPEQLRKLLDVYFGAKVFAELFDLDMITFLIEQYACNENLDIICD